MKDHTLRNEDEHDLRMLEQGLLIDEHALNESWQRHPDLFYRVSKRLAIITSRRDAAKQAIAEIEAEVDQQLRRAARVSEERVTEKEIQSQVLLNRKVQEAISRHQFLSRQVLELSALKDAYLQRSYALKDLVALYISNYYGDRDTTSTRQLRDQAGEHGRRAMAEERRRMNRQPR